MPNETIKFLLAEFAELKEQFTAHITESGGIKADIRWLKWFVMGIAGGMGAIVVALIIWAIKN